MASQRRSLVVSIVASCLLLCLVYLFALSSTYTDHRIQPRNQIPVLYRSIVNRLFKTDPHLCRRWSYDPSDYTLRYLPSVFYNSSGPCYVPENVRQVYSVNGTRSLTGCTHLTAECPELPHYDHDLKMRFNVPPCCRQHLLDIYLHFSAELEAKGIEHTLMFGAVLGWYRNRMMVPYDQDLDVFMDGKHWKEPVLAEILTTLEHKYNHTTEFAEPGKLRIYYSETNRVMIDVWPYEVRDGLVRIPHYAFVSLNASDVFPTRRETINGKYSVRLPRHPREHLLAQYGKEKDWIDEMLCTTTTSSGRCEK